MTVPAAAFDSRVAPVPNRKVSSVGDTPLDLQAGVNAGAGWVIGALSGAHGLYCLVPAAPRRFPAPLPSGFRDSA